MGSSSLEKPVAPSTWRPMQRRGEYERIRLALARSSHFRGIATAGLDRLAALAELRHLRHGQRVARVDAADQNLWIIVSGAVRISTRPYAGRKEVVHAVLGDGSYFGLANAVGHGPFTFEARSFGTTDVALIDSRKLAPILDQYPRVWRYVSRLLSERLSLVLSVIEDNRLLPLDERIARRLLSNAASSVHPEGMQPTLRMTQQDLARMLDAGRSRTNTALKRMESKGLVRAGYRTIMLTDVPALRSLAGGEVIAF